MVSYMNQIPEKNATITCQNSSMINLNCVYFLHVKIRSLTKIIYLILRFFTNPVFWLVENAVMFLTMPANWNS